MSAIRWMLLTLASQQACGVVNSPTFSTIWDPSAYRLRTVPLRIPLTVEVKVNVTSDTPVPPVLSLQVAVPKYPSTDVAYALAPNG